MSSIWYLFWLSVGCPYTISVCITARVVRCRPTRWSSKLLSLRDPIYRDFWLDLRVCVLTDVGNNGTQGTREFIQVWASVRIKNYVMCASVVLWFIGLRPPLPLQIGSCSNGVLLQEKTSQHPIPNTKEIVVFSLFFQRGFGLPTCSFLRGLLDHYKIELVHLNPNSILQIAVFVHHCEAFLCIPRNFTLFKNYFFLKYQPSATNRKVIRGVGLQTHPRISFL
jgi:hypothetical protein